MKTQSIKINLGKEMYQIYSIFNYSQCNRILGLGLPQIYNSEKSKKKNTTKFSCVFA